jgi:hypothetical protein
VWEGNDVDVCVEVDVDEVLSCSRARALSRARAVSLSSLSGLTIEQHTERSIDWLHFLQRQSSIRGKTAALEHRLSKVSVLVYLLNKFTIESTFEIVCLQQDFCNGCADPTIMNH